MRHLLIFALILPLCSCQKGKSIQTIEDDEIITPTTVNQIKTDYLSAQELAQFIERAPRINHLTNYRKPFEGLNFNKIIAYDFDGSGEPYPSVIKDNQLVPVIKKQSALDQKQLNDLLDFLTDEETYGGTTAACFEPHLAIVFYNNENVKFVINVCLDCNYLHATEEIPASLKKKAKYQTGKSYSLRGFSEQGKESIIKLCKELGFKYGDIEIKN